MRCTGGVWEWTMGGVWPSERFTGGMPAMCGCEETTTGDAWGWNWRGGMLYWGGGWWYGFHCCMCICCG